MSQEKLSSSPLVEPPRRLALGGASFELRIVPVEAILDLRWRILRQGLPFDAARFAGDAEPATRHFAAVETAGSVVVCCATFVLNQWEGHPAWQLRGMATASHLRGLGLGREVLDYAEQTVAKNSTVKSFWCNARVPAVGFYERQGWEVASEEFFIETAGPHRKMVKGIPVANV